MRYEVARPGAAVGVTEGLIADEWEIHPTGALIFRNRNGSCVDLVLAYAPGHWSLFFGTED